MAYFNQSSLMIIHAFIIHMPIKYNKEPDLILPSKKKPSSLILVGDKE